MILYGIRLSDTTGRRILAYTPAQLSSKYGNYKGVPNTPLRSLEARVSTFC